MKLQLFLNAVLNVQQMITPFPTQKEEMPEPQIDFTDTQVAFSAKTDPELKKMSWLFGMMNKQWLVDIGSQLGLIALKLRLPLVETIIKNTIFEQFVGGRTLLETQESIDHLAHYGVATILDYGAEAKKTEKDFNFTMNENIRALEFAAGEVNVPVISTKVSGLAPFDLLEQLQRDGGSDKSTRVAYKTVLKRLDAICYAAVKNDTAVFFDAEESWIQDTIDHMVTVMMRRYNKKKVYVYNTFQMYRHDRLQFLYDSYKKAKAANYKLGAKLVRGAYMEKEREYARQNGLQSVVYPNKPAVDDAYNTALRFCIDHYEEIASCNATHNQESNQLMAQLIRSRDLPKNHPHLNFCQLYGMSDHLTFNLAKHGFNVAKYVPYGQIREVAPYLIRRAQENSAVTGDMSREYGLIKKEMDRRGL